MLNVINVELFEFSQGHVTCCGALNLVDLSHWISSPRAATQRDVVHCTLIKGNLMIYITLTLSFSLRWITSWHVAQSCGLWVWSWFIRWLAINQANLRENQQLEMLQIEIMVSYDPDGVRGWKFTILFIFFLKEIDLNSNVEKIGILTLNCVLLALV